jgi:DDE superfamily endonuclease/Archaeal putative transposase ISC1217
VIDLPTELASLGRLSATFSCKLQHRFVILALGAIVAMGRRTVSRVLWAVSSLSQGHASSYHRFFSKSRWSMLALGRVLSAMVFELLPADQPIVLLVDDTVVKHRGDKVYGKGWHRDAVESTDSYLVKTLGHKWVVLAASVLMPGCKRPWALPLLAALYLAPPKLPASADGQTRRQAGRANPSMRSRKSKKQKLQRSKLPVLRKRNKAGVLEDRHKSPCLLARQLMALLIHWFPDRQFILIGDGGFASHELALFCWRHRRHVSLISRFHPDARLYALPSDRLLAERSNRPPHRRGRKRIKGPQLPSPQESVESARSLPQTTVPWYGQSVRQAETLSAAGGWYRCRGSLRGAIIPIRWVYVHELEHDGEAYFYSTDLTLGTRQIAGYFACRWSIEVTFQEVRAHLGFATPRQRCRRSVLRTAPCLLGLFSVVSLIYARLAQRKALKLGNAWRGKREPSFVDALATARGVIWTKIILPRLDRDGLVAKLPRNLRNLLLQRLTAAA